jgi:DNA-binding transcriptional MerR regulator
MRTFSTHEVSKLTQASVRQIDYWATSGLLKPSAQDAKGRGSRRRYTFQDIVAVQTIQKLREGFCPLQKIRNAVRYLRKHYPTETNTETLARLTLLTDGRSVYLSSDREQIMEVVTKQLVWSVPLGRLILDATERVGRIPTEWTQPVQVEGRTYHLEIQRDDEAGGYSVQCRELPGAIEQGRTSIEAVENGKAAVESVLEFLARRRAVEARVAAR